MSRYSRRHLLRGSLAMAGVCLLSGCGIPQWPGQQAARVPRIGFLATGTREGRAFLVDGFLRGMREHGYEEGRNILIEYRYSEDRDDRLPELAADPVATGLVASLAHPGGNVTGMSQMTTPLGGKRLETFKEIVPGLSRVAVFWNPPNPLYGPLLTELEAAASTLQLELQRLEVRVPEDFPGAFEAATRQRAQALIIPGDPLTTNRPKVLADLALQHRLPAMMDYRTFVDAGGLLTLGVDLADLYRRSAGHVDKILKGANPADLPVEQSSKFDLFINLKTATALGLTIPQIVLVQATEIIQ